MRSLVLSTSTNETTKYYECLANLNFGESQLMAYDPPDLPDALLYQRVKEYKPDFIVYIGQRFGKQPSIATLARINDKIAPSVHLCSDAADTPWWDLLRDYHQQGAFALQVAIDGSRNWPCAEYQMTALTPVETKYFSPTVAPHAERTIVTGYAGNPGSGNGSKRTNVLTVVLSHKCLDIRIRSNLPHTYEAYCSYLEKCRMSLNVAYSGTEAALQVKGRVLESALAGALLLETEGAPTRDWFTPGEDYIEYKDAIEAVHLMQTLKPEETWPMAQRMRAKVLAEHTPDKFWGRILDRLKITP